MENKKKQTSFATMMLIIIGSVLIGGIILQVWATISLILDMEQYRRVYQNPLTVTATVTHYEPYIDENDTDFYSYICYTVNGQAYSDIRYEDGDTEADLTPVGQQVQVQVSPEAPDRLMSELDDGRIVFVPLFLFSMTLALTALGIRNIRLSRKSKTAPTEEGIQQDIKLAIRTRFFRVFWFALAIELLAVCLRYPMLFGMGWRIACAVLILFWLICMYTTIRDYRMVENEAYAIRQGVLEGKEIGTDSDGDDSYILKYRSGDSTWDTTTSKAHFKAAKEGSISVAVFLNGRKKPIIHYLG